MGHSAYRFERFAFSDAALEAARRSLRDSGLLVLGEPHGVYETPAVVYALALELGVAAFGFEWSHDEVDAVLQRFLLTGELALEDVPADAEWFCGDGRFTAGHVALLLRLRAEGRLRQLMAFDRRDPDLPPDDWRVRDREMAERVLALHDERQPAILVTGAAHATFADEGTFASHLGRARPGLASAMLEYAGGSCRSRGVHDLLEPLPPAPIVFRLPRATPAELPFS